MTDETVRSNGAEDLLNVGILLFNDVELLDFAGPYEVFSVTAELNDSGMFKVFTIAETGNGIRTVTGLRIVPDYGFGNHPPVDVLVVPGGIGTRKEMKNKTVLDWVGAMHESALITSSVCTGALVLAVLGLLDGLESVTHHGAIHLLRETAPATIVRPDRRFIDTGKIITSGGISAGIDMSLHIVGRLYGEENARKTAAQMEYGNWR